MRVFVTGASGFIGLAVIKELISAGHQVLGLARTEASAKLITDAGAEVHYGTLEDTASLKSGAAKAEGVIHLAFIHDFSKFAENCEIDRIAIEALGDALAGTNRPLIVTSGTGLRKEGKIATEDTTPVESPHLPRVSEKTALAQMAKGVRVSVIRLPQVHDPAKQGFVSLLVATAKEKGVSAYVAEGLNRWPAVHVLDAAMLYRLTLEKGINGTCYHAIGEEGVTLKDIATAIGGRLNIRVVSKSPEEAAVHFGWLTMLTATDMPASSRLTQQWLGWKPEHEGMITDLENGTY